MNPEIFIGKIIGNYEIKEKIGEGAFSYVFLAEKLIPQSEDSSNDTSSNDEADKKCYFACKIIPRKKVKEKRLYKRLDHEIRILRLMHHPNVVQLLDILSDSSCYYIFLEFFASGDLLTNIYKNKHLSEKQAAYYFKQILIGLQYIHSLRVAHLDLKPENILIDHFGKIKISDFGLSQIIQFNGYGLIKKSCGSPCYMSPECISMRPYDGKKSDIWSCGVILYVMTVGHLPWTKRTQNLLFDQIKSADYRIPNNISKCCADLISRLLTVDPSQRITIKQALKHPFLANEPLPSYTFEWKYISLRKVDRFLGFDQDFEYEGINDQLSSEKLKCKSFAHMNFLQIRKNILSEKEKKKERFSSIVKSRDNAKKIRKKIDRKACQISFRIDSFQEEADCANSSSFFHLIPIC